MREESILIKVIEGYKLKTGADIKPLLLKLRSSVMTYPGYVGAENLISEQDTSIVTMISTWEKADDWRLWESSMNRQKIIEEIKALSVEEPRITTHWIIPTVGRSK